MSQCGFWTDLDLHFHALLKLPDLSEEFLPEGYVYPFHRKNDEIHQVTFFVFVLDCKCVSTPSCKDLKHILKFEK